MEPIKIEYIKDQLKHLNKDGNAETIKGEVAFQDRDALKSIANSGKGVTRSNTKWRRCEYIFISLRKNESVSDKTCFEGWKNLAYAHGDQTLILEEKPGNWGIYNSNSVRIGGNVELEELLQSIKDASIINKVESHISSANHPLSSSELRTLFDQYLINCYEKPDGTQLSLNAGGKDSYLCSLDIVFSYNPTKWVPYTSLYQISDLKHAMVVCQQLLSDPLLAQCELNTYFTKGWVKRALQLYTYFLHLMIRFGNGKTLVPTSPSQQVNTLQVIYYGAPGTGKSHSINEVTVVEPKENVFRTTFHPDSDYASFVGCYKPVTDAASKTLNIHELANELAAGFQKAGDKISFISAFYFNYADSIKAISVKELLAEAHLADTYHKAFDNARDAYAMYAPKGTSSSISYSFVPQTFLKAYMRAYQTTDPVFLVIEEINRGNCAQIFGDLFQLLDRKNGVSEYPIKADEDLRKYLEKECPESIVNGELRLPANLYIWATMNTSDQSLFPIDSAFKRRWDWEYKPIKYSNSDWKIEIGNKKYSWVEFQKTINKKVFEATESEDKQLGDYFVKADNNIISAKVLLNKVIFYLWNDVCKDGDGDIFKINTDLDDTKEFDPSKNENITFSKFFEDTDTKLQQWMRYLKISVDSSAEKENNAPSGEKTTKFGQPEYEPILTELRTKLGEDNSWYGLNTNGKEDLIQSVHVRVDGAKDSILSICAALDSYKHKQAEVKVWINNNDVYLTKLKQAGIVDFLESKKQSNCTIRNFEDNKVYKGWGIIYPNFPFQDVSACVNWVYDTMLTVKQFVEVSI